MEGDTTEAREVVVQSLRPASAKELAKALAMVEALVSRRKTDTAETAVTVAAYLVMLNEIPADIALYALKKARHLKWFPAWADLEELFGDAVRERELMLEVL